MNILGPDYLVFGVDDLAGCRQFLLDYGLREQENGFFSALDGTGVLLRERDDPSLPAALPSGSQLRETVYGVADSATLEAIAETLRRESLEQAAAAVASGSLRPREGGRASGGELLGTDPRHMTAAQRAELRDRIKRGERVYPR